MKDYLGNFHQQKEVFHRCKANKEVKNLANEATKELRSNQKFAASGPSSSSKCQKLNEEFRIEKEELITEVLTEGAHFNFPIMFLISHFADQTMKYSSLPQYSKEICEASHKSLKDAYRRTNHINIMAQILNTYTCNHNFAMCENNFAQWMQELQDWEHTECSLATGWEVRLPAKKPRSPLG